MAQTIAGVKRRAVLSEDVVSSPDFGRMAAAIVEDPRISRCKKHELGEILTIALMAVICGADGWVGIETWGNSHRDWLNTFLSLAHGIPSHDTFGRVFSLLDPKQLQRFLTTWTEHLSRLLQQQPGGIVAIDGKTLRRSFDKGSGQNALHLLNAWACESRCILGSERVEQGENEITAMPRLLQALDLRGCIVTLDAMGCQKALVNAIVDKGADYVVTLKGNHGNLRDDVATKFSHAEARKGCDRHGKALVYDQHQTVDADHGRIETRTVSTLSATSFMDHHPGWASVKSVIKVAALREFPDGKRTEQTRYFLSSLAAEDAKAAATAVRAHWGIENGLHWTLDTQMNEDQCRVRKDHAPENFALLRRTALSRLKQFKPPRRIGTRNKQMLACSDPNVLLQIMQIHTPA